MLSSIEGLNSNFQIESTLTNIKQVEKAPMPENQNYTDILKSQGLGEKKFSEVPDNHIVKEPVKDVSAGMTFDKLI